MKSPNPEHEQNITPGKIMEQAWMYRTSRMLLTAVELGVFDVLDRGGLGSAGVAEKIKGEARAVDRLLNALVALGYLAKDNGIFSNTPATAAFLVKSSPDYLAGLDHAVETFENWTALTRSVKDGTSAGLKKSIEFRDTDDMRAFIAAMHTRALAGQADDLAETVGLSGVSRVLDVGGGSGAFVMAMASRKPELTGVVFDLPAVTVISREFIKAEGLEDRIHTLDGDYRKADFGRGFDLVLLSAIVHINSYEQNRDLINRCGRTLNPGGRLVISDFIMDEDRTTPVRGAFFALHMLVGTQTGDTYTQSDMTLWLESAGLGEIERLDTPGGLNLMIGRKK